MDKISSTKILGTKVSTEKKDDVLKKIIKSLKEGKEKFYIVTPNPEIIMYALREKGYQEVLNQAQVSLPDGIGVLVASKMLKKGILERITGVDLMVDLVRECTKEGLTTGFFGGTPGVAEKAVKCLQKSYPNLKVSFVGSEWGSDGFEKAKRYQAANSTKNEESKTKLNTDYRLRSTDVIDILFVALGFPKQEKWIANNLDKIPVTAAMGVGGSFDYISGNVRRAPKFLRSIGLEWAFRLINEPWRIKRQLVLPIFFYYIIKVKFFGERKR